MRRRGQPEPDRGGRDRRSGLQNLGDGFYQYNWGTHSGYVSSCRTMRLDLGDDLLRTVEFRFTA
jgi:hypothetical protein